jgi:hypothetical protein
LPTNILLLTKIIILSLLDPFAIARYPNVSKPKDATLPAKNLKLSEIEFR